MKKVVLKVDLHADKDKQKAMKVVSKIPCVDSIAMDMKARKLTVIGDMDPVTVVNKLRKYWATDILSVGPAKEPEKKKDGDGKPKDGGDGGGGDPNTKTDGAKIVLKADLHDDKDKLKAMKLVTKIPCVDSIAMDMKAMKLTVIGDIDPVTVVNKLRKYWATDIYSVGPAKEPEKKKDGDGKPKDGGDGGGGDPNTKTDGAKIVLKADLHDDKDKLKAMKVISKIPCVDSIAMDMKDMKLTVIGDIDPVTVVKKLRKYWVINIYSVGPAKEPEKNKDGDSKLKDGGGGGGGDLNKKKDDNGKDEDEDEKDNKEDSANNDAFFFNVADYNAWRSNARMANAAILIFHAAILIFLAASSQVQKWHSKALSLSDAAAYSPNKENLLLLSDFACTAPVLRNDSKDYKLILV